jgi:hypothetical protein
MGLVLYSEAEYRDESARCDARHEALRVAGSLEAIAGCFDDERGGIEAAISSGDLPAHTRKLIAELTELLDRGAERLIDRADAVMSADFEDIDDE